MAKLIDIPAIDAYVRELGHRPTKPVYYSASRDQVIVQFTGWWLGIDAMIFAHRDGDMHWKPVLAAELDNEARRHAT